jgi:hypothetical protein
MSLSFNQGALPAPEEAELENLIKKIHEPYPYDPFQDWEDWRLWMLSIRGHVLAFIKKSPDHLPVITRILATSVMSLALYDLQKKHDAEGRELRAYAKTHPLLSAEEVPKEGIAYVDNWGFVHWQRQKRLIAQIQLYEYLTQPNSDWLPPETKRVNLPMPWLEYINSFDAGFSMSLWGTTAHWSSAPPAQTTTESQNTHQATPSSKQFISDLCRPPLSQADFSELLVRLGAIDSEGNCLTNNLKGKASSKRGAFIAAYRVLHRADLLEPVTNSQLGEVLSNTYQAEMGAEVLSKELTGKGMAPENATSDFTRAVDICKEWLAEWKTRLKITDNA